MTDNHYYVCLYSKLLVLPSVICTSYLFFIPWAVCCHMGRMRASSLSRFYSPFLWSYKPHYCVLKMIMSSWWECYSLHYYVQPARHSPCLSLLALPLSPSADSFTSHLFQCWLHQNQRGKSSNRNVFIESRLFYSSIINCILHSMLWSS